MADNTWRLTCRKCHETFKLKGSIVDLAEDRNCPSCDFKTSREEYGPLGERDYEIIYWFLPDVGLNYGG